MPRCFLCNKLFSPLKCLILHYKIKHSLSPGSKVLCVENDCQKPFSSLKLFQTHYNNVHLKTQIAVFSTNELPLEQQEQEILLLHESTECLNEPETESHEPVQENPPSSEYVSDEPFEAPGNVDDVSALLQEQAAHFAARLFSHTTLPRNMCQTIIEYTSDFMSTCSGILYAEVDRLLKKEGGPTNDDILNMKSCFSTVETPFKGLETDFKRKAFFANKGFFIEPEPFSFGEKRVVKKKGNKRKLLTVNKTGQHVPLRRTLKLFFQYENLMEETLTYIESLTHHPLVMFNLMQGSQWQKNVEKLKLENPERLYLPIIIYNDEYEAGNPLSSHAGTNKLSAVYATIPCLPPKYLSSLNAIFLCLLFKASDAKGVSHEHLFRVLIDELIFLRETGIEICTPTRTVRVCFIFSLLSGDNLELNDIGGYVMNFSRANYPCRICKVQMAVLHRQVVEEPNLLRNPDNYSQDLQTNDASVTGIREECCFNRVPGFHITTCCAGDVMHDIFEGVAGYNLVFLFNYLIDSKMISYELLCLKISDFDYGLIDSRNKPANMHKNFNRESIKLSASEMITLVKYLPLILGDFVPPKDQVWELFLIFKDIVDLLMAPEVQKGSSDLLKLLIRQHHELYLKLTKTHLVFKFHMMIHYPTLLELYGPLIRIWCMRMEAKHQKSKMAAAAVTCRINTPKTLTWKDQLQFCYFLFSKTLFRDSFAYGPTTSFKKGDLNCYNIDISTFPERFMEPAWIEVNGFMYKSSMILLCNENDDIPCFGEIIKICLLPSQSVFFVCKKLEVIKFDHHYHSYHVQLVNSYVLVSHDTLFCEKPFTLSRLSHGREVDYYIVKHHAS